MKSSPADPFQEGALPMVEPGFLREIIKVATDVAFFVDADGRILDTIYRDDHPMAEQLSSWISVDFAQTLQAESRPKFTRALQDARVEGRNATPFELNHDAGYAFGFPVKYSFHRVGSDGACLLLGLDWQDVAQAQQRLLQAQIAVEKLNKEHRQTQTRLAALMQISGDGLIIANLDSNAIEDMNDAARLALGLTQQDPIGRNLSDVMYFDGVQIGPLKDASKRQTANALNYREGGRRMKAIALSVRDDGRRDPLPTSEVLDAAPFASVVSDRAGRILSVNPFFVDLCGQISGENFGGETLANYLIRGDVDQRIILDQIAGDQPVVDYPSGVTPILGPVVKMNITAFSMTNGPRALIGWVLHPDNSASVEIEGEQVTDVTAVVGSNSLKDIVNDAVVEIERACIKEALRQTGNNRAAAAEILGLSRQSLYVKLRKFNLETKTISTAD